MESYKLESGTSIKQALIVDDSKSARVVLKRMLEGLNLVVNTVESALDAIDYLKKYHPDVIFMDHMMPGMDGFEAVKQIKNDSETAVIPIMMYTSRGGDVYLSQARALGAVGIIPKTISPVGLKESLFKLGLIEDRRKPTSTEFEANDLIPDDIQLDDDDLAEDEFDQAKSKQHKFVKPEKPKFVKPQPGKPVSDFGELEPEEEIEPPAVEEEVEDVVEEEEPARDEAFLEELGGLMDEQTIELHKSMWLGIESVSHEIFNRLNKELDERFEKIQQQAKEVEAESIDKQVNNETGKLNMPMFIVSVLLLLSFILNLILLAGGSPLETENVASVGQQEIIPVASQNVKTNLPPDQQELTAFVKWAQNKKVEYPYNELALSDTRLVFIENLVNRALKVGYKGQIILQTHIGQFCMNRDINGNYALVNDKLSITNCETIGNYLQPTDEPSTHQSLAFANYLSDSALLNESGIEIVVANESRFLESARYPKQLADPTVKEWNYAARLNNYVMVKLNPTEQGY